jgi:alpha-L-arabinofuranosidase
VLENAKYEDPLSLLSASASVKDNVLTLTMANMELTKSVDVNLAALNGSIAGKGTLRILQHADPMTCNTFENPYAVVPTEQPITLTDDACITLPAASIAVLTVNLDQ